MVVVHVVIVRVVFKVQVEDELFLFLVVGICVGLVSAGSYSMMSWVCGWGRRCTRLISVLLLQKSLAMLIVLVVLLLLLSLLIVTVCKHIIKVQITNVLFALALWWRRRVVARYVPPRAAEVHTCGCRANWFLFLLSVARTAAFWSTY